MTFARPRAVISTEWFGLEKTRLFLEIDLPTGLRSLQNSIETVRTAARHALMFPPRPERPKWQRRPPPLNELFVDGDDGPRALRVCVEIHGDDLSDDDFDKMAAALRADGFDPRWGTSMRCSVQGCELSPPIFLVLEEDGSLPSLPPGWGKTPEGRLVCDRDHGRRGVPVVD